MPDFVMKHKVNTVKNNTKEEIKERDIWSAYEATKKILYQCDCGCCGEASKCRNKKLIDAYKKIRVHLFYRYLRYSRKISILQMGKIPSYSLMDPSDVRSSTCVGLLQSIDRFDSNLGVSFTTFSYSRMVGEVIDDLRRLSNFTTEISKRRRMLIPKIQILTHELSRFPSLEDIRDNFTVTEFQKCLDPRMFTSVFNQLEFGDDKEDTDAELFCKIISDIRRNDGLGNPAKNVNKIDFSSIIYDPIQQSVLYYYYYFGLPLHEIALIESKSISYVSRVKTAAEEVVRKHFGNIASMKNALYGSVKNSKENKKTSRCITRKKISKLKIKFN